jgi:hypothetical protein
MDDIITGLLYPQLRKLIYGAGALWIGMLLEWAKVHNVPITEAVVDNWISILIALVGIVGSALWTWAKNKITSKTAVTVPTAAVPEIVATVEAGK